jgi:ATP-dependent exoDNAse (exonuclease V) beta subunit
MELYRPQLDIYKKAVKELLRGATVKAYLLFTATGDIVEV